MKKFHTKDFLGKFSIFSLSLLVLPCLFSSCQNEEDLSISKSRSTILKLNVAMPLESVTVSMGYESGSKEENTISDYRIYIYDTDNKYIMSLNNPTIDVSDTELNTVYTITAEITDEQGNNQLEDYSNFKVVMLANWEEYATPQAESTIDDLCNSEYAQYSAFATNDFNLSSKHIPFYGVHQYTGVTFPEVGTEYLKESLTLLRAMAKVEIVIDCEDDVNDNITLASATLHNYNSKGYCAPANVYSQSDYGQAKDWANDYTGENMHLVNDENDSEEKTLSLYKVQDKVRDTSGNVTQKETWIAYVPEYDNQADDFSYIDIVLTNQAVTRDTQYRIYFAVYDDDGTTKAYDSDASTDEIAKRRDIHRNNLYRFNIDFDLYYNLRVNVQDWENAFDNEWTFGTMDGTGEVLGNDSKFYIGSYAYVVIDSDNRNVAITYDTTQEGVTTNYQGDIVIPEIVRYDGVDYNVVAIYEETFYLGRGITSVSIPKTVTYIGDYAFYDCEIMNYITCYAEVPPTCGEDVFSAADVDRCILYVPQGCVEIYSETSPWSSFSNIQEIDD